MRAIIYIRVSTEEQARHGYSLEGQESVCVKKAKELGAAEIEVFRDEGISGSILERPSLQEALEILKNSKVNFFVVYDPDRLSRKLSHQLLITETIEKTGCRLEFVNFEWENTPEGRLFYSMRGAIAEYEKEKFLIRSKLGKVTKARRGLLTHNPKIYGYRYVPGEGKLEIDEEQSLIYHQMVQMCLGGASPEEISKRLNSVGIPGPKGGVWYRATVRRILKNTTYTGTLFLNRYNAEGVKTQRAIGQKITPRERPKDEWIAVAVPPLISLVEWEAIQENLVAGKKGRRGQKVHFYLLSKILYCGVCGHSMYGTTVKRTGKGYTQKIYRYYVCSYSSGQEDRKNFSDKCKTGYYSADNLEELVWLKVKDWLIDPEALVRDIQSNQAHNTYKKEVKALEKHLGSLAKEKDRVFAAFRRGILELDDFEKAAREIKEKQKIVEKRLQEIQMNEEAQKQFEQGLEILRGLAKDVVGRLDELGAKEREHLIYLLINRIMVDKNEVLIEAKVPQKFQVWEQ